MSGSLFGSSSPRGGGGGGGGGYTDPLTTRGDVLIRDATDSVRLAVGTTGQVLTTDGVDVLWGSSPSTAAFTAMSEPTGFASRTESTISYDDATRTLTIAPTGATFDYWISGVKHSVGTKTKANDNIEGTWFFYLDSSEVLQATQTWSTLILRDNAICAIVYWDVSAAVHIYLGEERHGTVMDGITHEYLHAFFGTQWVSGGALGSFSVDDGVPDNASAQFDCSAVAISDEDIYLSFTDGSPQDLSPILQAPIFHRLGAAGDWQKDAAGDYACKRFGTDRLAWNEFTGGAWQQTEVSNNDFVLVHIWATNDVAEPIIAIQGQAVYGNRRAAREGATTEISNLVLSGLPAAEFTPLGSIILQTSDSYGGSAVKARVVSTDEGADYVDFRSFTRASTGSTNSHSNLSSLLVDDHPQYALLDGRSGGQVLIGGTDASDDLQLSSTSDATKGVVYIASGEALVIGGTALVGSEELRVVGSVLVGTTVAATTFDTNVAAAALTLSGTTLAADGTDDDIDITITPKGLAGIVLPDVLGVPATTTNKLYQSNGMLYFDGVNLELGFVDPMSTRGDIIIRNAANATARLAVGGAGEVLTSDGTDVAWAAAGGGGGITTYTTVAAAELASGSDNDLCYVVDQDAFFRYEASGAAWTRDGVSILNTADGGDTRWLTTATGTTHRSLTGYSVIIGHTAGLGASSADYNVIIGHDANSNGGTIDAANVAIGWKAMENATGTGVDYNTCVGSSSGKPLTAGYNAFYGSNSGISATSAASNCLIGYSCGYGLTTGGYNTITGRDAGYYLVAGAENAMYGYRAGWRNYGSDNTFIGTQTGANNYTGSGNVFLGYFAGQDETGSNKLYIANSDTATPLLYGEFDNDLVRINGGLKVTKDIVLTELADHSSTPAAGFGILWVKNAEPAELWFTDDAGTDTKIV